MKDLVILKTFDTALEAGLARGLLASNGIDAIVDASDKASNDPFPTQPALTGIHVFVKNEDLEKAKKILKEK